MKTQFALLSITAVALIAAGCAKVDTTNDWQTVRQESRERLGMEPLWLKEHDQNAVSKADSLIADGLTREEAASLALAQNHELQARFEQLGIARADLEQAGLYTNPSVSAVFRRPDSGGSWNNEAGLGLPISDLWQVPLRKDAAEASMAATTHETLSHMTRLIAEVERAYTAAQYTEALGRESSLAASRVSSTGGPAAQVASAQLQMQSATMTTMHQIEKRKLSSLMGLNHTNYDLSCNFAPPSPDTLDAEALIALAEKYNPDLAVRDNQIDQFEKSVKLQKARVLGDVNMGVGALRDHEKSGLGQWYYGPSLGLQLPIFDQNQAGIAKAEYAVRQARSLQEAERAAIRARVHNALDTYAMYKTQADMLSGSVIPAQTSMINNGGGSGSVQELNAYQAAYLQSLRGMYDALAELGEVTGTRFIKDCMAVAPVREAAPVVMPVIEAPVAPLRFDGPRVRLEIIDAEIEASARGERGNHSTSTLEVQDANIQ